MVREIVKVRLQGFSELSQGSKSIADRLSKQASQLCRFSELAALTLQRMRAKTSIQMPKEKKGVLWLAPVMCMKLNVLHEIFSLLTTSFWRIVRRVASLQNKRRVCHHSWGLGGCVFQPAPGPGKGISQSFCPDFK